MATFTDDFAGTGALSGNWTLLDSTISRVSDKAHGSDAFGCFAGWATPCDTADQYAQVEFDFGQDGEQYVACCNDNTHDTTFPNGYLVHCQGTQARLLRNRTQVVSFVTGVIPASGVHTLKVSHNGSGQVRVSIDGTIITGLNYTDGTPLTTKYVGFGWGFFGFSGENADADNFAAGDNGPPSFTGTIARTLAATTGAFSGTNTAPAGTIVGSIAVTLAPATSSMSGTRTAPAIAGIIGSTTAETSGNQPSDAGFSNLAYNTASGLTYTATTGDTVTQVAVYASGATGAHTTVAIYTVSGGNPATRVGSAVTVDVSGAVGWKTASASIALTGGVTYTVALGMWVDNAWTWYYGVGYSPSPQFRYGNVGALPSTWSDSGAGDDGRFSYYATVSAAADEDIEGTIARTLAPATGVFTGTHTLPTFTGTIAVTLAATTSSITGTTTSPGVAGNIAVTLNPAVGVFTGSRTLPAISGTIAALLAPAVGQFVGGGSIDFSYPATVASRKLLDQHGQPYLIKTMASWAMGENCSNAEITAALEGLAAAGFNAVTAAWGGVDPLPGNPTWHNKYVNDAGQAFFTGTPFQSSLGPAWASMDHLVSEATRLEMTVLFVLHVSWGLTGTAPEITTATTSQMYNFGAAVATRYATYRNIIWHVMNDVDFDYGDSRALAVDAYCHGIVDTEGTPHRLITTEPDYPRTAYDQFISQEGTSGSGYEWFHVSINTHPREPRDNAVDVTDVAIAETGATTEAYWTDEPMYVNSTHYSGNRPQQTRERNYTTFIRGGVGINFGNEHWWVFGSEGLFGDTVTDWLDDVLDDVTTHQASYCWAFADRWCSSATFLPVSTFVTTGLGSGDTKAAAGASGTVAVAYFPTSRTVVVDTTILAGTAEVRLRWYDPVGDTYTTITDSEAQNASRSVSYPANHADGTQDWILLADVIDVLTVANSNHAHTADIVLLSAPGTTTLAPADSTHAHTAGNVTLTVPAATTLTVADGAHAHAADNVTLTVPTVPTLTVATCTHAHAVDGVVLGVDGAISLNVANSAHAHTADNVDLTQEHNLVAADAYHAHTAGNVVLVGEWTLVVRGGSRRSLTIQPERRQD